MVDSKIKSFEDLRSWQVSIKLAKNVYKLTASFPSSEQFGITNQLRRASTSISANIAEGFGRDTVKDKQHFYTIAYGSLLEVKNFIYLSVELGFLIKDDAQSIINEILVLQKMLNASKTALKNEHSSS